MEIPRIDPDEMEIVVEDAPAAPDRTAIAKKLQALADIAEREVPERIPAARRAFAAWMAGHPEHTVIAGLAARLKEMGPSGSTIEHGLVCSAALTMLLEARDAAADPVALPPLDEDLALAAGETLHPDRLAMYVDMAPKWFEPEALEAARIKLREEMRSRPGLGDPMVALGVMLLNAATPMERALWTHAAVTIRDEGRADRDTVPTQDTPAPDPEKIPAKKKRAKAAAGWVKAIGTNAATYLLNAAFPEAAVLAMLQDGAFARARSEIKAEPAYGWCHVGDPLDVSFTRVPRVGDGDVLLFGLRRDQKQGIPRTTLRLEAAAQAKFEAVEAGKPRPEAGREKEIYEELLARWYRDSTPQTTVTPVTWHVKECRLLIHTASPKVVAAAADLIRKGMGLNAIDHEDRVALLAKPLQQRNPAATDIRKPNGVGEGAADLGSDFLLFLVARAKDGTGVLTLPGDQGRVEWWIENDVELERSTADEKALRMKLAGAPTEGGSLFGALADGASIQSARIALRHVETERTYHVTLAGLTAKGWGLPAVCVPDGTAETLDSAVVERLALYAEGERFVEALRAMFAGLRVGSWGQIIQDFRRRLGIEIATRYAFDEATGQGVLFREMLPAQQEQLFAGHNAETPPAEPTGRSRGRAARDAAVEAVGEQ